MKKINTAVCALIVFCNVFLMALSASAASLQLVPNWGASGVPSTCGMFIYVPDKLASNPPIMVLCHYWGASAGDIFAIAKNGGLVSAADQYGFIIVVPQTSNPDGSGRGWDANSTQSLTHNGGGESQGIAEMVSYAIKTYNANANRVYVTGVSSGAMMTEVLLAAYPDVFKAGVEFSGVPAGAWAAGNPTPGGWSTLCASGSVTHTSQEWGDMARAMYPGYSGPRPRVQLWHGTSDSTISYNNHTEAIKQWTNVLGLSTTPTSATTETISGHQYSRQIWKDSDGKTILDAWSETGAGHSVDTALNAQLVIPFFGLDKPGAVDPGSGGGQRGRPILNTARTTFVGDDGETLRGPFTSTEWTAATSGSNIARIKSLGFNAVHLYAECFDPNYPNAGSTAPGYRVAEVDKIVEETRLNSLYLILTIGNGAANGRYNMQWVTDFWKLYSARYANETHVLFEIQNEPVAWGPPYSSASANPPGAVDMEVAAYNIIRASAPNTPVLLFTYSVIGGSGGSNNALTDIHAFNQAVFGNPNAVWTNEAVGVHGYAGANATLTAVQGLLTAGYPCFMTEFVAGTWGGGPGGLDVEATAGLERLGVSWLTFAYIPPTGVSVDVTIPEAYRDRVENSGLSWVPNFGSFPQRRGVYGNNGYPWTTPDYINNSLSGTLRIQAEDFDNGGKNVAYYNANNSNRGGQYRTGETVGIEITRDTEGGYNVCWIGAGDWLEYTVNIPQAGSYDLRLRVAGWGGRLQMSVGGVDVTGTFSSPYTGGWQTWTTITKNIFLEPGQQKLHINVLGAGFNLNWIELSPVPQGNIANGTYKFLNAANALALDLNTSNTVITATYSATTSQQWNLRHIGGGQYQVSSVPNGSGWDTWMSPLHLSPWGWGAGGRSCFIFEPTGDGYYSFCTAGGGTPFEPSLSNPPTLRDGNIYTVSACQKWAILSPTAPVFPSALSATATSSTQNSLSWTPVAGASSYNVKRSLTSGGPYTTVATGLTTASYTDANVSSGVKYYYVISAVCGGVESLNSIEGSVALPYPWRTLDIGAVGLTGSAGFDSGVFSVVGSGADVWGSSDSFRFVYVPVTGSCSIIARVASLQNVSSWSKAGVMIRNSLNPGAANVFIAVTPGNGINWQFRSTDGGGSGSTKTAGLTAPYWVKLVWSGSTVTGYSSQDGATWTLHGSTTFSNVSTAYVGLAITSHNNSALCTGTFDNVSGPGWP